MHRSRNGIGDDGIDRADSSDQHKLVTHLGFVL